MEAVKSYRIPVDAPPDLIEAYFEARKRALDAVLSHVRFSNNGKAPFGLQEGRSKKLRDELLRNWKFPKTLY